MPLKMRALKYAMVYLTPLIVVLSLAAQNLWSWSAMVFVFVLIPFLELFTNGSEKNLSLMEESIAREDRVYDWLLYGLVPVQYGIMVYFLFAVGKEGLSVPVKLGMTTAFGLSCGILGINAAHELGHRSTRHEQLMSKMLLLTSLYMHFFIEHNRGHHRHVSTDEDPASSRRGETVYAFYLRTIYGSWVSAWKLEHERLQKKGLAAFGLKNEMLQFQLWQAGSVIAIGWVFGLAVLGWFLAGATMGFLLLETVNYIEHYGLRRQKHGDRYERTQPRHSWNSNHPLGRLLLLELSRHSDHHYQASRKYQILRHFEESPQMPTGYPGMMLLSLVPPLWFWIMHRQMDLYNRTQPATAATA